MEREIKLVALDLDGTTFNSEKVITERTREAIAAAIKKGVIVMPATGRQKTGLPESFTSIPGVRYALTSNGGAVVDLWEDSIIYADFIPYKTACRVMMVSPMLTEKVITEHFMFIKTSRIGSRSILRFPEYRWMICENGFIRESLI